MSALSAKPLKWMAAEGAQYYVKSEVRSMLVLRQTERDDAGLRSRAVVR